MTKVLSLLAAASLLFGACSVSNQIAQQKDYNDDVYYSDAKAKEITVIEKAEKQASITKEQNNASQPTIRGNIYNDYSYSGGIYYYLAPWRSPYYHGYNHFYDPYFDYYGYNSWYSPGVSVYVYPYRNLYGYPYLGSTYWGPVSYNNYYPGYSYGGNYGGNYNYPVVPNNPNYRARPSRGTESAGGIIRPLGTIRTDAQGVIMSTPSRGETYEKNNVSSSTSTRNTQGATSNTSRTRPARTSTVNPDSQGNNIDIPSRVSAPQIPTTMTQPSSSGNNSSGGGSSSSDDGSRARPARAGN